jgi:hypothetical protein
MRLPISREIKRDVISAAADLNEMNWENNLAPGKLSESR